MILCRCWAFVQRMWAGFIHTLVPDLDMLRQVDQEARQSALKGLTP